MKKTHDLEPYVKMAAQGAPSLEIISKMVRELKIKTSTAQSYYYTKVRNKAATLPEESIPPVYMQDTTKRVKFSPEERERIRRDAGVYINGEGTKKYFNPGNAKGGKP